RYRTYMRPRYKVAYKMVTEMEWKCCQGYSGEDCNDGPAGGTGRRVENEKMRQMEEKIQSLTKNLQDLQSTMNEHFQQGAHDKTLVNINNHLVNGKGNDLDGGLSGGGLSGGKLNLLKEEILRELERRVSLSCSSCQVGVEDLHRQQQEDRERIRALEKQLNAWTVRYRQELEGLRREVVRFTRIVAIQSVIFKTPSLMLSARSALPSENFDVLQNRMDKELRQREGGQQQQQ
ncbi:EMILIN-1, partial [Nibea albiflora]